MAGTNVARPGLSGGPAVILVEPQLGENIGMAARAMLNCGLTELRIVKPREPWPNRYAVAAASGADQVLEDARIFGSLREAVADLRRVYATTARHRDMVKPILSARETAVSLHADLARGERCGVLFGRERTGLTNEDVMVAHALITIPLNPAYSSLNLAQAVLLVGYEWLNAGPPPPLETYPGSRSATAEELAGFFDQLEGELDDAEFFRTDHQRPTMWRNLRNIFLRASLTEQEIRTLRGMLARLAGKRRPPGSR